MTKQFIFRAMRMAAIATAAGLGACTTVLLPPNITPVIEPSTSVADAARKLRDVKAERERTEAEFAASEQVCYAKFFVNNCLDAAKEKRRGVLAYLNAVEVEAEYYQRKADVDARDREVAKAVKQFEADEQARALEPDPPARVETPPPPPPPKPTLAARKATQAAKMARNRAEQAIKAGERAEKARKHAELVAESAQRQKKVEEKKAEKAARAAAQEGK